MSSSGGRYQSVTSSRSTSIWFARARARPKSHTCATADGRGSPAVRLIRTVLLLAVSHGYCRPLHSPARAVVVHAAGQAEGADLGAEIREDEHVGRLDVLPWSRQSHGRVTVPSLRDRDLMAMVDLMSCEDGKGGGRGVGWRARWGRRWQSGQGGDKLEQGRVAVGREVQEVTENRRRGEEGKEEKRVEKEEMERTK